MGKGTDVRPFQNRVITARSQMPREDPAAGAVRVEAGIDVDGHERKRRDVDHRGVEQIQERHATFHAVAISQSSP